MPEANPTHDVLIGVSKHDPDVLEGLFMARLDNLAASGLDPKSYAIANLAALVAINAAPASYVWQVGLALDAGVTPEEILGLLVALNPLVGNALVVTAAPNFALALGVDLGLLDGEG